MGRGRLMVGAVAGVLERDGLMVGAVLGVAGGQVLIPPMADRCGRTWCTGSAGSALAGTLVRED